MIDFRMFIVIEAQIGGVVGVVCDYHVGCRSCANLDEDFGDSNKIPDKMNGAYIVQGINIDFKCYEHQNCRHQN